MQGREHLHPEILRRIEQSEKDGGIFLKDVPNPDNSVIYVHTRNSIYAIAVVDKDTGKVAIQGNNKHLTTPEICYLRGSTWGGSMIKVKWIGVGMRLELNTASGGIMSTSGIKTVVVKEEPEKRKQLVGQALATEPKYATKEEIERAIQEFMNEKFTSAVREKAWSMVSRFSLNGQIAISGLLAFAHEQGKFDRAITLLEHFYEEHWVYQHPEVRGDPGFTTVNAAYIERAYNELGIELPNQR